MKIIIYERQTFYCNVSLSAILHDSLCINDSKVDTVAWGQSTQQDNLIRPSAGLSTLSMFLCLEHIKVKVKLSLCTSYKAYGSGGSAPLSLNLGTRRRSIVSFIPRLVYAPTHKEEPLVYTEEKAGWVPLLVWMLWRRKQNLLLSLRIKQRFLGCSAHSLATVLTMQFQLMWPDHKGQKRNATSTAISTMSNWPQRPSQMTTNSS